MELTVALAWLTLVVAFPLNAIAAYLLWRKWREAPHLRVLRERFIVAVVTTLLVLFFGVIFVNNDQTVPPIGLDATKVITRAVLLAVAFIVAGGWLLIYLKLGRSKEGKA